jgi:hypothetical protein
MTTIEKHYLFNTLISMLEDNYRVSLLAQFTSLIGLTLEDEDKLLVSKSIRIVLKVSLESEKPKYIQRAFKHIELIPPRE